MHTWPSTAHRSWLELNVSHQDVENINLIIPVEAQELGQFCFIQLWLLMSSLFVCVMTTLFSPVRPSADFKTPSYPPNKEKSKSQNGSCRFVTDCRLAVKASQVFKKRFCLRSRTAFLYLRDWTVLHKFGGRLNEQRQPGRRCEKSCHPRISSVSCFRAT